MKSNQLESDEIKSIENQKKPNQLKSGKTKSIRNQMKSNQLESDEIESVEIRWDQINFKQRFLKSNVMKSIAFCDGSCRGLWMRWLHVSRDGAAIPARMRIAGGARERGNPRASRKPPLQESLFQRICRGVALKSGLAGPMNAHPIEIRSGPRRARGRGVSEDTHEGPAASGTHAFPPPSWAPRRFPSLELHSVLRLTA